MATSELTIHVVMLEPALISTQAQLPTGQIVCLRPLTQTDGTILGTYFLGLSAETRRRYGPHPFDQATADQLCAENDYTKVIRMLATIRTLETEQVLAYFILVMGVGAGESGRYEKLGIALASTTDCTLAPSVADTYQDKGLGSIVMQHVIDVARRLGKHRIVLMGGTQASNARGIHFYKKHGFRLVGDFEHPPGFNNHDMVLEFV